MTQHSDIRIFKNTDDMTAFVLENTYNPTRRWMLERDYSGTKSSWRLSEAGLSSWSTYYIRLAPALASDIEKVWTKKPEFRGSDRMKPAGMMTVPGILKRLGKSEGLQEKILSKKQKEDLFYAKNRRNSSRDKIRTLARNILHELQSANGLKLDPELLDCVKQLEKLEDEK